jgi:predicted thioredoxin/glutaredoxin
MEQKRVILRVEVAEGVPEAIDGIVDRFLSTNVSVVSRAVEWLCAQDSVSQALVLVLGLYPETEDRPEATRLMMEHMAKR